MSYTMRPRFMRHKSSYQVTFLSIIQSLYGSSGFRVEEWVTSVR